MALEQAGDRQRLVAQHFGREATARAACQQAVLRIAFGERRTDRGRLLIGRRRNEQLEHALGIPAAIAIVDRQPIEQLGMRRGFALRAELLGRFDDADAEQLLPQAIDGHARGERIVGVDEPIGQAEAIELRAAASRMQRRGHAGGDRFAGVRNSPRT